MKIAHISDLHFFHFSWQPWTFITKRALASLNYLLFRRKVFNHKQLFSLVDLFRSEKVDLVVVSGDLTTTGHKKELKQAARLLRMFEEEGIPHLLIPGNHDFYLKKDEKKKRFYRFFGKSKSPLATQKIESGKLSSDWWYVALDTAYASPLFSSQGLFHPSMDEELEKVLNEIPKEVNVLCVNHFPIFAPDGPRRALKRRENLCEILKNHPEVKLYIHGHTHKHSIADLRSSSLPIILDAGCASYAEQGTFNMIELENKSIKVETYSFQEAHWQPSESREFPLEQEASLQQSI